MNEIEGEDLVGFGGTPAVVNSLLQQGVWLHRHDFAAADQKFREALALDPTTLAGYFCLYKIHGRQGGLDCALAAAEAGLAEASRQAGLPLVWRQWTPRNFDEAQTAPARFALYTLKATAFIHLRRDEADEARRRLDKLEALGACGDVGQGLVADLERAVAR